MKYIKEYNWYIDPFDEEDWGEKDQDGTFITWLRKVYPDETEWDTITDIYCAYKHLTSLEGVENLTNLREIFCAYNQLTSLKGIESLYNLNTLWCYNNQLTSLKEIKNLTNLEWIYCSDNQLTTLEEIKNLNNLKYIDCSRNNFSDDYKKYIRNYCRDNNIVCSV